MAGAQHLHRLFARGVARRIDAVDAHIEERASPRCFLQAPDVRLARSEAIEPSEGFDALNRPEGIYLLADGTHTGSACCWDFGNVTPDPASYAEMNTLMLGEAYWGDGNGQPPWFGADLEAGVWMGGSEPGDPGWGDLNASGGEKPPNPNNPSMNGVEFALGFLKTNSNVPDYTYALRMADISSASLTTAWEGPYPKTHGPDHQGAIVLGVAGDNSNNSFGTFYEGAVYKGYPDDATAQAVMDNIKAVGYGQ